MRARGSKPTHVQAGSSLALSLSSFSSRTIALISSRLSLNVSRCYFFSLRLSPRPLFLREIHSPSLSLIGSSERDAERRDDRTCASHCEKGASTIVVDRFVWTRAVRKDWRREREREKESKKKESEKRLIRRAGRDKEKGAELEVVSRGRVKLSHERKKLG